ncbi:MAG: rod shape-determining protein MreD [Bacteroidales bacterium]|nr:rod shape-determining protein MreD [Bacteroidales bacterium]
MLNNIYTKYIFLFISLALLQAYVLNNILFLSFLNPYLYVYAILTLPIQLNRTLVLILSFIYGLLIDILSSSYAIHTFSTTVVGFIRPFILKIFSPFDGYEINAIPSIKDCGHIWWLKYSFTLIILHNLCLFTIEEFNYKKLHYIIFQTLLTSIFTFLILYILELIKNKKLK